MWFVFSKSVMFYRKHRFIYTYLTVLSFTWIRWNAGLKAQGISRDTLQARVGSRSRARLLIYLLTSSYFTPSFLSSLSSNLTPPGMRSFAPLSSVSGLRCYTWVPVREADRVFVVSSVLIQGYTVFLKNNWSGPSFA